MINVYTYKNLCPQPMISLNDKEFNKNISSEYLDVYCRQLMKAVDDAEILDETLWTIKTKLGTGEIRNLSTGVKTLINIHNMKKHRKSGTVDIREVGENLIPHLLNLVDDTEISIYTGKYNFVGLVEADYTFIIDNVYTEQGTIQLSLKLEELRGR